MSKEFNDWYKEWRNDPNADYATETNSGELRIGWDAGRKSLDNTNDYRKICHILIFFGDKVALAKRLKEGTFHFGFYSDAGGKVEKGETLLQAARRETIEETGLELHPEYFEILDSFLYHERKLKTFLFQVKLPENWFNNMANTEPLKQENWELFTVDDALKLDKLMPSVKYYLEGLKKL